MLAITCYGIVFYDNGIDAHLYMKIVLDYTLEYNTI